VPPLALQGAGRVRGDPGVEIRTAAFSPDGKFLLVGFGCAKGGRVHPAYSVIKLWNVKTGKEWQTLAGHEGGTNFVTFFPDGKVALSTGDDEQVKLWFVAAGTLFQQYNKKIPSNMALTAERNRLLASYYSAPEALELWDALTGKMIRAYPSFKKRVRSLTMSPDGKLAILACELLEADGVRDWSNLQVWDMHKGELKLSLGDENAGLVALAFSPDSKFVLGNYSARKTGKDSLVLWEAPTGKIVRVFATPPKYGTLAAFGPAGKQVVVLDNGGYMRRFDVATGKQLWSVLLSKDGGPGLVAFSQDARFAVIVTRGSGVGFDNLELDLWDAVKGQKIHTLLPICD
jgi:WD40 repeat protein